MKKSELWLITVFLMIFNLILENFVHLRFPLDKDDGFFDIVANNFIHLLSVIALGFLMALGIDYFIALIPGQKRSNGQRFWNRLPAIFAFVSLYLLLDYIGRIIWLMTWGSNR
ncbi:hypothetical protein [Dyadobacter soli]|nr:hypothetical protein [Dyadobacter soli]